jgi:hypothetical protein
VWHPLNRILSSNIELQEQTGEKLVSCGGFLSGPMVDTRVIFYW